MITVGELKAMLDDIHDDSAAVIVKYNDDYENDRIDIKEARREHIFSHTVKEECTTKDGKPFTYTKAEYDERVVLVI